MNDFLTFHIPRHQYNKHPHSCSITSRIIQVDSCSYAIVACTSWDPRQNDAKLTDLNLWKIPSFRKFQPSSTPGWTWGPFIFFRHFIPWRSRHSFRSVFSSMEWNLVRSHMDRSRTYGDRRVYKETLGIDELDLCFLGISPESIVGLFSLRCLSNILQYVYFSPAVWSQYSVEICVYIYIYSLYN